MGPAVSRNGTGTAMLSVIVKPFGTLLWMLFGLEGRMTREQWWLGMVLVWTAYFWLTRAIMDYSEFQLGLFPNPVLQERIELIALLMLIYPTLALCQKRLHDRGYGVGGIMVLTFLPYATVLAAQAGFQSPLDARDDLAMVFHYALLAITALAIVEMGALSGQSTANQHGPDPKARNSRPAADAVPQPIKAAMIRARAASMRQLA
jgi:uncharacterized membrane protein YhaH (DUF805 family)